MPKNMSAQVDNKNEKPSLHDRRVSKFVNILNFVILTLPPLKIRGGKEGL